MKKLFNLKRTALLKVCSEKSFRIMKLVNLLLLVAIFNVFGSETYSQYARLNPDEKDFPIQKVLNPVEGQLDEISASSDINYTASGRQILLVNKETGAPDILQQNRVTGTVIDETGNPMPGVNVLVEGTTVGVITDINGKYSINIPNANAVLIFSFIGYNIEKISAAGKTAIDVKLISTISALNEVVVIGYGTQKKSDLTGSVVRVNMTDKVLANNVNLLQALQGDTPGFKCNGRRRCCR